MILKVKKFNKKTPRMRITEQNLINLIMKKSYFELQPKFELL